MDNIVLETENTKKKEPLIETKEKTHSKKIAFQKMIFIMNAIDKGWSVKKKNKKFIFCKKKDNKKEYLQDNYLDNFVKSNFDKNIFNNL